MGWLGWGALGLGWAGSAFALDLDALVEAWTQTVDGGGGSDGADAAHGVAIDSVGNIVAVGHLDGPTGHGTDGYAVAFAPDGSTVWELALDAGEIGLDRASSDDRYTAVAIEPLTDSLVLCGASGPADLYDPATRYLVDARTPDPAGGPPLESWRIEYVDGAASPDQSCLGATWSVGRVLPTGWAVHGTDVGRWVSWVFDESNGAALIPPVTYEYSLFEAVPDRGQAIALNTVSSAFAVAGTRGFAGLPDSLANDTDAHVRYYDAQGSLLWSDTLAGVADLDDQFLGVAIDVGSGDVFVVGHVNGGTDNGPGADYDWVLTRYDDAGDGLGGPAIVWSHTWSSGSDTSEGATAIVLDDVGDLLIGGWSIDPATGVERWRVAKHAAYDGVPVQEWLGPARAGSSRVTGLSYRAGQLAIVGVVDDGTGQDFATTLLGRDLDGDGVADAVDACPDDPTKAADEGICGCNVPDVDTDADGVENCIDGCPTDGDKLVPGVCGCEVPDEDRDADGTYDCDDRCPDDPDKADDVGVCGCGAPDSDTDGDGVLGCNDACNNTAPGTPVDAFGCPLEETTEETGDTGTAPPPETDKGGCGCASGAAHSSAGLWAAALLAGIARSRRTVRSSGRDRVVAG